MKTTVKTFWICTFIMLVCSISGKAIDFTKTGSELTDDYEASASTSSISAVSDINIDEPNITFSHAKLVWSSDVELGTKPLTEIYTSNQQRLRRVLEDNLFLRNIFLILSNHENLLVQGQTKLYFSDKAPYYALTGSDYYIFTLRRILI